MGKYIVKKPIVEADTRYERGSEIELTDERAAQIGSDYVEPVVASMEAPASEEAEKAPAAPEAPASPSGDSEPTGDDAGNGDAPQGSEETNEQ